MRTTILLSTLLFLAGYAAAQDSPITVGDTSSQPPLSGKKAGTKGHSTYLQHKQFQSNGGYVEDPDHKVGCFEVVGWSHLPIPLLDQQWTLTLNDKIELKSTKVTRVDIDYKSKKHKKGKAANGDETHTVAGDQLTSGDLSINHGTPTTYPVNPTTPASSQTFIIHYCQITTTGVDCTDPVTHVDTCNPPPHN